MDQWTNGPMDQSSCSSISLILLFITVSPPFSLFCLSPDRRWGGLSADILFLLPNPFLALLLPILLFPILLLPILLFPFSLSPLSKTVSEEGGLSMQSCKMSQIWLQIYLGKIFGCLGKTLQTVFEEKAYLCARLMTGNQFEKQPKTGNRINHARFSSALQKITQKQKWYLWKRYSSMMFCLPLQNYGWLIFWKPKKAWWLWFGQQAEKLWR